MMTAEHPGKGVVCSCPLCLPVKYQLNRVAAAEKAHEQMLGLGTSLYELGEALTELVVAVEAFNRTLEAIGPS